jgi:hypothetical protein
LVQEVGEVMIEICVVFASSTFDEIKYAILPPQRNVYEPRYVFTIGFEEQWKGT